MSTKSLMDNKEVFNSEKIWARNKCPDGNINEPVCDENIVSPFATITPIRELWVVARISTSALESRIATYVPDDPESALILPETEKALPRSTVGSSFLVIISADPIVALGRLLL